MKVLKNLCILLGAGLFANVSAQAAIVNVWGYDIATSWTSANPVGAPPNGVAISGDSRQLSWGATNLADRSSLTIGADPNGTVNTYIGAGFPPPIYYAVGSALTHHNEPIPGLSLTSAWLRSTLSLYASGIDGLGPVTGPSAVNLNILFTETPNSTPCTVSSPTPCNDIFVLATPLQNQSFVWDSQTYFVNIFPTNGALNWLTDAACATVGITTGASGQRCVGFTTPENRDTQLNFGFTVSTERLGIPEPGSLALIGIALLGAAGLRKRQPK